MSCTSDQVPAAGAVSAIPLRTREAIEAQIRRRVEAERAKLQTHLDLAEEMTLSRTLLPIVNAPHAGEVSHPVT